MTTGGGSATAGGMNFQHSVAAWLAVQILAEKSTSPPWNMAAESTLEWIRCETEQPVDDIAIGTSTGGLLFVQAKRTLNLSASTDSEFYSVADQFVRQFISCRAAQSLPWIHPLEAGRDKLVLATSTQSPATIREALPKALQKLKLGQVHSDDYEHGLNEVETEKLGILKCHIQESWKKHTGSLPSDDDLLKLLSVINIEVLDLDNGRDEQNAKTILRTAVLNKEHQSEVAWSTLVNLCSEYAENHGGGNRTDIQKALMHAGIHIAPLRSYQKDIAALRDVSSITKAALTHLSDIRLKGQRIKIQRPSTLALRKASESSSILVVGEPGAGKSGTLVDLVDLLEKESQDFVFVAVDHLSASSLPSLKSEFGLEHNFVQVLENWTGEEPAYLIIDALDAARGNEAINLVKTLMRIVIDKKSRWHIVASIRKFDLRYGVEIRQLFPGQPVEHFYDKEFPSQHHINIPKLSEDELLQFQNQSSELQQLIANASIELLELLKIPFNLRLVAELIDSGTTLDELSPIRTQLELLERYWLSRVVRTDGLSDAREGLLLLVCKEMIKTRKLQVQRAEFSTNPDNSPLLNYLLSSNVLTEWSDSPVGLLNRNILAFSHHVLFDYAVARLVFRQTASLLLEMLTNEPDLSISLRPSLVFHFRYVWIYDLSAFWQLVFNMVNSNTLPEIAKLIGPTVAAEHKGSMDAFETLFVERAQLDDSEITEQDKIIRHILGALLTQSSEDLAGAKAGPWCNFLECATRNIRFSTVTDVQAVATKICSLLEKLRQSELESLGEATRRLLSFAWSQPLRNNWLIANAIKCVCITFKSDQAAASALLRQCLEPGRIKEFGFEELPRLCAELEDLIPLDPLFIEDVYVASFENEESSSAPTSMGNSRILPMTSNRSQDYRLAHYELEKLFHRFLEIAPHGATRALVYIANSYVAQKHPRGIQSNQENETFEFNGQTAHLQSDFSSIWDEGDTYEHDEPRKMLSTFQKHLLTLCSQPDKVNLIEELISIIVSRNSLSVMWRRIIQAGVENPTVIGNLIAPLTWSMPILTCIDTTAPIGELLKVLFPLLNSDHRERIENSIISIAANVSDEEGKGAVLKRNRLLGCLSEEHLVTRDGRILFEQLNAEGKLLPNEPPFRMSTSWEGTYTIQEFLRDSGVDLDEDANNNLSALTSPVTEFADRQINSVPSVPECEVAFANLQLLYKELMAPSTTDVHPQMQAHSWGSMASAASRMARSDEFLRDQEKAKVLTQILLQASYRPEPAPDLQLDKQFDDGPHWGGSPSRLEAAVGLVSIGRTEHLASAEVMDAIKRLASDPVPSVRFQIAIRLTSLYKTNESLMWTLLEQFARSESSISVLEGMIAQAISRLAGQYPDRAVAALQNLLSRDFEKNTRKIKTACARNLTDIYIWIGHDECRKILVAIISNPASHTGEALSVASSLRRTLIHGDVNSAEDKDNKIRQRTIEILNLLLTSAKVDLQNIEDSTTLPFHQYPQEEQEKVKELLRLIDCIGSELYFASGAFESKKSQRGQNQNQPLDEDKKKRFYDELLPTLEQLSELGIPNVTHSLLKTLEYFIPNDPRGVFLCINKIVEGGKKGGYQYELMAADLIVSLVERFLAEYRPLLRDDDDCRKALISILDVFVLVGWPAARSLTYRLEEIYR